MSRLRPQRLILGLIALLAIGWAQTFGLHRGWVCDCGGVEFITQVDHCHGPHSTACHDEENEDHSVPHHHGEEDGDTHEHPAVVDSLVAKQQNDFSFSIATPVKVLGVMNAWETIVRVPSHDEQVAETPPPRAGPEREWPRRLAQTIALRI